MLAKRRISLFLGARTVKTGIAVFMSLFLSRHVPYSLPLLAGVAAIICMQPSITAGIQKGIIRIKATIFGGLFGLGLHYLFGNNLIVIGLSVIVILWICHLMKWEEGISLAALTVMAILLQVSNEVIPYAAGRVISTLIGIVVATLINIIISPPRHQIAFRKKMNTLTEKFPDFYLKAVEAYAQNKPDLANHIQIKLNEIKADMAGLQQELNHMKEGTRIPLGNFLEGIDLEDYLLFNQSVHFLGDIVTKLEDLLLMTQRCHKKRQDPQDKDDPIQCTSYLSTKFTELMEILQNLSRILGQLHISVFKLLGEQETESISRIHDYTEQLHQLKELSRQCLREWETEYIQKIDFHFLMSTYRVIFDLEEMTNDLTDLAKAAGASVEGNKLKIET